MTYIFFGFVGVVLVVLGVLLWRLFKTFQKFERTVKERIDWLAGAFDAKVAAIDEVVGGMAGRGWDKRFRMCKEMFARKAKG